jgi:hypothetical protein
MKVSKGTYEKTHEELIITGLKDHSFGFFIIDGGLYLYTIDCELFLINQEELGNIIRYIEKEINKSMSVNLYGTFCLRSKINIPNIEKEQNREGYEISAYDAKDLLSKLRMFRDEGTFISHEESDEKEVEKNKDQFNTKTYRNLAMTYKEAIEFIIESDGEMLFTEREDIIHFLKGIILGTKSLIEKIS